MWIEEQANGKFKYCERYKEPLTGKTKKVAMIYDKKGPKAEKIMRARLQEKIDEKLAKPSIISDITLYQLIDIWISIYSRTVKDTTYRCAVLRINNFKKAFGNIKLDLITDIHINRFLLNLTEKNLTKGTIRNYKHSIAVLFNFAIEQGYYADKNILNNIKIPNIKSETNNEFKYLEHDELAIVIERLTNTTEKRMAQFQTLTGLRFGEMIAFKESDINYENKTLNIERQYNSTTKTYTSTKTNKPRLIYLNNQAISIIREQIHQNKIDQLKFKKVIKTENIFINRSGKPYQLTTFNKSLKNTLSHKHVSSHIFRHTFITYMLEQGVPPRVIAEQVGHSNAMMIEKVYAHISHTLRDKLKKGIENLKII